VQTYFSQVEDKVMNLTKLISHYLDIKLFFFDFDKFLHGLVQMCKLLLACTVHLQTVAANLKESRGDSGVALSRGTEELARRPERPGTFELFVCIDVHSQGEQALASAGRGRSSSER
jgi:hypothetical protein